MRRGSSKISPIFILGLSDAYGSWKMVADTLQVARISLLKFQPVETRLRSAFVPGVDEVLGNVDSNNVSPQTG